MNWKFWKREKIKKKDMYPCSSDNCLVRMSCSKMCDKLIKDPDELRNFFLKYGKCPDCGSPDFYEGACGGLSMNMKCASCGHWFNIALPFLAERIHIDSNGRFLK